MPNLISYRLKSCSSIDHCITGSFSKPKACELIVSKGSVLELLEFNSETNRLVSKWSQDTYSLINQIGAIRVAGSNISRVVVTSDSGAIAVLQADNKLKCFQQIHIETFGKTGNRRVVPSAYLAVEPKGRAIMIGAIERSKFVYQFTKTTQSEEVKISSPLEANKSSSVCLDMVALDVDFDSPVFATLEYSYEYFDINNTKESKIMMDKETIETKCPLHLILWNLDVGLNHVMRKCALSVPETSHKLMSVRTNDNTTSGTLVCCDNYLVFKKPEHPDVYCAYPRRLVTMQDMPIKIITTAFHRLKDSYIYLLQSNFGDLYKVELFANSNTQQIEDITVSYFDSIPITNCLTVLKTGALFAACQSGDHLLFMFQGLGDADEDVKCTSAEPKDAVVPFKPRALENLSLIERIPSLAPITNMICHDVLKTGTPQLLSLCGTGSRSSLRVMQVGLNVNEIFDNELPGRPTELWAHRSRSSLAFDDYMIVSFTDGTLILKVDSSVEEDVGGPFETNFRTYTCQQMMNDVIVQVHSNGINAVQFMDDGTWHTKKWSAPASKNILAASANNSQIVVALHGGNVILFEISVQGQPNEIARKEMGDEIKAVALPQSTSRMGHQFVAVAGSDCSVRILSVQKDHLLRQLSALYNPYNTPVEGIAVVHMEASSGFGGDSNPLYLFAGLQSGILIKAELNPQSGLLMDMQSKYLESSSIRLRQVTLADGSNGVVSLSKRPWLSCVVSNSVVTVPLHFDEINCISTFSTSTTDHGYLAAVGNRLKVISINHTHITGNMTCFSQNEYKLTYTPRKILVLAPPPRIASDGKSLEPVLPESQPNEPLRLAILETEQRTYDLATRAEITEALKDINVGPTKSDIKQEDKEEEVEPDPEMIGTYKAEEGKWGSLIRIINPENGVTHHSCPLDVDESAVSGCVVFFLEFPEQPCLVIGTAYNATLEANSTTLGSIKVFAYDNNFELTLLHSTAVDGSPTAICEYKGMILVGIGKRVRLYSLGRKKLLRKCEYSAIPQTVSWIQSIGERIFVGDVLRGFLCLRYIAQKTEIMLVCDYIQNTYLSACALLDYSTVIGGDKFGNVSLMRIPAEVETETYALEAATNVQTYATLTSTGAKHKLERINMVHLGDIPVSKMSNVL